MNILPIGKAMLALAILAAVAGCQPREDQVGPAQKAGAAIDNAGNEVARKLQEKLDKAEQAGQKVVDAARTRGDQLKDATQDAAQDANRGLEETTREAGKKVERAGEKIQDAASK